MRVAPCNLYVCCQGATKIPPVYKKIEMLDFIYQLKYQYNTVSQKHTKNVDTHTDTLYLAKLKVKGQRSDRFKGHLRSNLLLCKCQIGPTTVWLSLTRPSFQNK